MGAGDRCCAIAAPFILSGFHLYQLTEVLIDMIALIGLNLLTGYNGQISLGHGAFFALGGYLAAILSARYGLPFWASIPLASFVCFVAGFLFGFPALKFGGLYLALATFALAVAAPQILSYKGFDAWTGGKQGLELGKLKAPEALHLTPDQWTYAVTLIAAAFLTWVALNLVNGRIGRALIAIRDHAIAAETMGIDAALYKTTTFGLSALYAGVAGGLSAFSPSASSRRKVSAFLFRSPFSSASWSAGSPRSAAWCLARCSSNSCRTTPTSCRCNSAKPPRRYPGAIYGVLLILIIWIAPSGVAGLMRSLTRWAARSRLSFVASQLNWRETRQHDKAQS